MPIQMIGTRRSGSNLLRVMIGQLEGVFAPQSTHMLEYYIPLAPYYGNLAEYENFKSLVNDMCICVEQNPVPWDGVILNRDEIVSRCKENKVIDIFNAIYSVAAEQNGCHEWMCKCLGYINYFDELEEHFGDTLKYIYIYRDGRDVALSFSKAIAGHKHSYFIGREWATTQDLAESIRNKISTDRFHAVCYEELLEDPETKCREIAKFIGLPFTENMLNYHQSKLAQSSSSSSKLWGNISKPILADNTQKFLKHMDGEEVKIFESVAGNVLDRLGYRRHFTVKDQPAKEYGGDEIDEFQRIDEERKHKIIAAQDKDDMKRRNQQKEYVDQVKERLGCSHVKYHGNMLHSTKKQKRSNSSEQSMSTV